MHKKCCTCIHGNELFLGALCVHQEYCTIQRNVLNLGLEIPLNENPGIYLAALRSPKASLVRFLQAKRK